MTCWDEKSCYSDYNFKFGSGTKYYLSRVFFFLNDHDFMKFKYIYAVLAIETLEFGYGAKSQDFYNPLL